MPEEIVVGVCSCTHPHIFPRIELLRNDPGVCLAGCYDPDPRLSAAAVARRYRGHLRDSGRELPLGGEPRRARDRLNLVD
ncbi:MAG: hypothetical protein QOF01_300 [Thermomicrobiales bacterium]|nr:hypothetical protein [Thermomicrobiales bacterium]MEA2527272.1 hypothetical protein [Thermomicrobiales bacterium]MEA2529400.1 hypothetical protein [Thermomicrobiales bacterium]MEA2593831.1 hypothetical protein [Thermomicrobiales bacterium]